MKVSIGCPTRCQRRSETSIHRYITTHDLVMSCGGVRFCTCSVKSLIGLLRRHVLRICFM